MDNNPYIIDQKLLLILEKLNFAKKILDFRKQVNGTDQFLNETLIYLTDSINELDFLSSQLHEIMHSSNNVSNATHFEYIYEKTTQTG